MSVFQLAYVSATEAPMRASELASILDVSQKNNTRDNVTGVLIYGQQMFFQILEGTESAVRATFSRIQEDRRHIGISVTLELHCQERAFPDWSMGYGGVEHDEMLPELPVLGSSARVAPCRCATPCHNLAFRLAQFFALELANEDPTCTV